MTDKNKDALEAFEQWLKKTIDCKYTYDPLCGYLPQEVYQLHQAFMAGQKAALTAQEVVTVEEIAALIKSEAHIAYPWTTIMAHYPNGLKIVKD